VVGWIQNEVGHSSCAEVCVRTLNGNEGNPISIVDSTSMLASDDDVRYEQYLNGRHIPKSAIVDGTSTRRYPVIKL
jgi:hypothetical protein